MASSSGSPCAACKFLRRKCTPECVFAPYFPPDQPQKFASVHKIFGASNITKLLNELPHHQREDAVNSLAYEAAARVKDPVYGCVGAISILQQQVIQLQKELALARSELGSYTSPVLVPEQGTMPVFALPQQMLGASPSVGISMAMPGLTCRELIFSREQLMELARSQGFTREQVMEYVRVSGCVPYEAHTFAAVGLDQSLHGHHAQMPSYPSSRIEHGSNTGNANSNGGIAESQL